VFEPRPEDKQKKRKAPETGTSGESAKNMADKLKAKLATKKAKTNKEGSDLLL